MDKTEQILVAMLIIIIALIGLSIASSEQKTPNPAPNKHSVIKAICNSSSCQDYVIECKNQEPISMTPITGATIFISENFKDPRTQEQINNMCE